MPYKYSSAGTPVYSSATTTTKFNDGLPGDTTTYEENTGGFTDIPPYAVGNYFNAFYDAGSGSVADGIWQWTGFNYLSTSATTIYWRIYDSNDGTTWSAVNTTQSMANDTTYRTYTFTYTGGKRYLLLVLFAAQNFVPVSTVNWDLRVSDFRATPPVPMRPNPPRLSTASLLVNNVPQINLLVNN